MTWEEKREKCIVAMQVDMTHKILKDWELTPSQFVEMDIKYGINRFIREHYEILHLSGSLGIMEEIKAYMERQGR